jgi:hypothetical protein
MINDILMEAEECICSLNEEIYNVEIGGDNPLLNTFIQDNPVFDIATDGQSILIRFFGIHIWNNNDESLDFEPNAITGGEYKIYGKSLFEHIKDKTKTVLEHFEEIKKILF